MLGDIYTSSIFVVAAKWGLVTGLFYHFTCQSPQQRDVLTCLCSFTAGNLVFIVVFLTQWDTTFSGVVLGLGIFDIIMVVPVNHGLIKDFSCDCLESHLQCLLSSSWNPEYIRNERDRLGFMESFRNRKFTYQSGRTT
jgi:hypothetical protein